MWPSRIVFVRHAESEGNVRTPEERSMLDIASHNYALTERGRAQAKITGEYIRKEFPRGFAANYTSYYRRARETMDYLTLPGEKKIYEDPRLCEAQRGIFHTYSKDEVEKYFPLENKRKSLEGYYHYRPPGGENWPDVELRIHSFLTTLNRDLEGKQVLIVMHGHWFTLFQRMVHHFSIEETENRYKDVGSDIPNASVTVYASSPDKRRLSLERSSVVPWLGQV